MVKRASSSIGAFGFAPPARSARQPPRSARRPQRGQIEIRGPAQPLGEEPERGVEVAVASCHDQVERRVALIGTEIADAFRHDLQIEVPFLELPAGCRWPPGRHRLVALLRPPTAIQHQCWHPSVQIGERLVVELTVRIIALTVAAVAAVIVLVRRWLWTISQRQQRRRDLLGDVGRQRRQLVRLQILEALGARPAIRRPGVRVDRRRQHRLPPRADQVDDPFAGDVPALRLRDAGTVVEQRLAARAGLAHVRRRQDRSQRRLDRRIFAVDVDRDQAVTGLTGNDADTGVARGPALALGRRRRTAVEAPLPIGEADPHAGEEEVPAAWSPA